MTTLYRPALIESAEQAEALPEGTIATHDEHWPAVRCTPNRWESSARDMKHADMVGWTALVPIEAEEDFQKAGGASVYDGGMGSWPDRTRLVTPWEAV